ncbi:polysaccharide deacetylase family protein [Mesorhizobium sp. BE184]|uniref:polysaccharide deacetylase family protein n=1 Tax=Mesorhizobium sp. BE184 TaxID=2817714 RepID=UPI0028613B1E|nr:polysaccharide deacetylase family protein [Mesorhizobium sp. BE184]MDR7033582.1 peptidoglycan/xylan/chitin deacetylase (PgdA/CDA1 family) [Mesorhizobium sp. BE184]
MPLKNTAKRLLKHAVIRTGLEAVALSRAGALWPAAAGRGLIFTLHHVRPAREGRYDPNALLSVTPEFLDQAIRVCAESGLTPVALEDLPKLLADPNDTRRFVCFALDDGYRNNAEHAAPVFRSHGVPYTIFITRGFVERTSSMWWETAKALTRKKSAFEFDFGNGRETMSTRSHGQKLAAFDRISRFVQTADEDVAVARLDAVARSCLIDPLAIVDQLTMDERALRDLSGDPLVRFGAHTLTHVNLRRVGEKRLAEEMAGSATAVEAYVGRAPQSFAYPYGFAAAAGEREFEAAAQAGFAVAVTTQPGVLTAETLAQRPTALPRVSLNGLYQRPRYVRALISGIPFRFM